MGDGLSKEQEQCFRLIRQLFKAAGCLPDKGSLDLEIWEKAGQRSSHNQESLDQKRRDIWAPAGPFPWVAPAAADITAAPGEHQRVHTHRVAGLGLSAWDRRQQQRKGWSPSPSLLPV